MPRRTASHWINEAIDQAPDVGIASWARQIGAKSIKRIGDLLYLFVRECHYLPFSLLNGNAHVGRLPYSTAYHQWVEPGVGLAGVTVEREGTISCPALPDFTIYTAQQCPRAANRRERLAFSMRVRCSPSLLTCPSG